MTFCFNGLSATVQPEEVSGKYVTAVFVEITFLHLQYCLTLVFALYIYFVNPEAHPEVLAKTWDPTGEYIGTLQHNLPVNLCVL